MLASITPLVMAPVGGWIACITPLEGPWPAAGVTLVGSETFISVPATISVPIYTGFGV